MTTYVAYQMGKCQVCERWYQLDVESSTKKLVVVEHMRDNTRIGEYCPGSLGIPKETKVLE